MITLTSLLFSGIKSGTSDEEVKLFVDIQNDWLEITHTKEISQVINKTTGIYIRVRRNTLKSEVAF